MKLMPKTTYSFCISLLLCGLSGNGLAAETTRVSVASDGTQGNLPSYAFQDYGLSADGRYAVFESDASNLVVGDGNGVHDIFVHDRQTHQTTRVSVDSSGLEGTAKSYCPSLSADGRYVAFTSDASNLVTGDSNNFADIFVHDRQTRQTTRVSVGFALLQGSWYSDSPSISSDGRYVAFASKASNLIGLDADVNGASDIFVRDRQTGQTTRVSETSAGGEVYADSSGTTISADGRYVAFQSNTDNLVAGDNNRATDVFVHDRQTRQTTRVSISSNGVEGIYSSYIARISADGRYVAFTSDTGNLVDGDNNDANDIFVHDRQTGQTNRVSVDSSGVEGNGGSYKANFSADGRYVVFDSFASNLVPGDTNNTYDTFVHDRQTRQTRRVSVNSSNQEGNASSENPTINADGRHVAFTSEASNLVTGEGDKNDANDVFVRDRALDRTKSADMQIAVTQQPASLALNAQGGYTYRLTNNGPDTIGGVSLTHLVSKGAVASFTPSKGSCKRYATIALCQLGTLSAGQSMTVRMTVKALSRPNLEQQISVSAVGLDTKPGNNSIKVVTPVN